MYEKGFSFSSHYGDDVREGSLVNAGEALRIINGLYQPITELLVAFVRRQVQTVETCVSTWVTVGCSPLLNGKRLRTVASVKFLETIHWHA